MRHHHGTRPGARRALATVAAITIAIAACGSDDDASGDTGADTTTATSEQSTGSAPVETAPEGTTDDSAPADTATAEEGGEFIIGFTDGLGGPTAASSAANLKYLEGLAAYYSEQGPNTFKVVSLDDASDPARAAANATQLITRDNADVIVSSMVSSACPTVAAVGAENEVPVLCYASDPESLSPGQPYLFQPMALASSTVPALVEVTAELQDKEDAKVVVFSTDLPGSVAWVDQLQPALEEAGYTVEVVLASLSAPNIDQQISEIIRAEPDIVIQQFLPQFIPPLVGQMRAAGIEAPVVGVQGSPGLPGLETMADPEVYQLYPVNFLTQGMEGEGAQIMLDAMAMVDVTSNADLNAGLGPQMALPALVAIQGLDACGFPCDGPSLSAAIENLNVSMPGFVDEVSFTPDNHNGIKSFKLFRWNSDTGFVELAVDDLPAGAP